jgi:hypothetical protein
MILASIYSKTVVLALSDNGSMVSDKLYLAHMCTKIAFCVLESITVLSSCFSWAWTVFVTVYAKFKDSYFKQGIRKTLDSL